VVIDIPAGDSNVANKFYSVEAYAISRFIFTTEENFVLEKVVILGIL
jgi:hypothetical protein